MCCFAALAMAINIGTSQWAASANAQAILAIWSYGDRGLVRPRARPFKGVTRKLMGLILNGFKGMLGDVF